MGNMRSYMGYSLSKRNNKINILTIRINTVECAFLSGLRLIRKGRRMRQRVGFIERIERRYLFFLIYLVFNLFNDIDLF